MALKNPFKLEKLTITAYQDEKRLKPVGFPFKALFNPESYRQKHSIEYAKAQAVGASAKEMQYAYSSPSKLSLDLISDGTGCYESASQSSQAALDKEIYGSPKYYRFLAKRNQLDNFRDLIPGQRLFFPPVGAS